jgi:type II secretory pathway component PulK
VDCISIQPNKKLHAERSGSILILVLWVLFFLAALAVAVGSHVSASMTAAARLWERSTSRSLAEAGAHQALFSVLSQTNVWDGLSPDAWNRDEQSFEDRRLGDGSFSVFYYSYDDNGSVVTNVGVMGEDGKLNLNFIQDETIKSALSLLIASVGKLPSAQADLIILALEARFKDGDEELTEGAASRYYPMRSLAEFRMVDGVNDQLFSRLEPYLTVCGLSRNVNLNCAPESVLVALYSTELDDLDLCESLANKIVEFRGAGQSFRSKDDLSNPPEALGLAGKEVGLFGSLKSLYLCKSSAFGGLAQGQYDGQGPFLIEFVCDVQSGAFVYWRELQ